MTARHWIMIGAISGFISVAMGAFGAHALAGKLSERALEIYQTAAQYQIFHALALLALGVLCAQSQNLSSHPYSQFTGWAFTAGTLLFSGSLYALALTDIKILGAITPLGGVSFLAGWVFLAALAKQVV